MHKSRLWLVQLPLAVGICGVFGSSVPRGIQPVKVEISRSVCR